MTRFKQIYQTAEWTGSLRIRCDMNDDAVWKRVEQNDGIVYA